MKQIERITKEVPSLKIVREFIYLRVKPSNPQSCAAPRLQTSCCGTQRRGGHEVAAA